MLDYNPMKTPMECWIKLLKFDECKKDSTIFKSLIGSLRYLTCTRPNMFSVVEMVSHFIEIPISTHMKDAKRTFFFCYLKGIIESWIILFFF